MFSGGNVKALASPQRSQIIMDFAPSNSLSLFLIIRIAYTENGNAVHKRRSRRSQLGNVQKGLTSRTGLTARFAELVSSCRESAHLAEKLPSGPCSGTVLPLAGEDKLDRLDYSLKRNERSPGAPPAAREGRT
jgi:hypothetical protein